MKKTDINHKYEEALKDLENYIERFTKTYDSLIIIDDEEIKLLGNDLGNDSGEINKSNEGQ